MRRCIYCRCEVADDATECPKCLYPLKPGDDASKEPPALAPDAVDTVGKPTRGGDFLLKFAAIVIGLSLIVQAVAGVAVAIGLRSALVVLMTMDGGGRLEARPGCRKDMSRPAPSGRAAEAERISILRKPDDNVRRT
jgi:hypothetical protein